jgi:prepilin-type N-terminal cleavage/methylation domain-containing protein
MPRSFSLPFHTRRSQKGFSLIEILIVVVLFGLLVGISVANYRRLNERKRVENAAKQVEQALRDAQKRASAGVKPVAAVCDGTNTLDFYRVSMIWNVYWINAFCSGGAVNVGFYSLPEKTWFEPAFGWTHVAFSVLSQGATAEEVCVRNESGSMVYVLCVDQGGAVSFLGQQGSCSCP